MKKTHLLLADDHQILLDGLRRLLCGSYEIVGMARDGRALVALAPQCQPDVIVTDIAMPELNGVDALLALQKAGYSFKVIFLTMLGDTEMALQALRAGAAGFVLKESAGEELVTAIEEALNGRIYVTPRISKSVLQACLHPSDAPLPSRPGMTQRQGEVLRLLAEGRSMKEAAAALGISARTVEAHKYQLMHVLGLRTNADLVQFAMRAGFLHQR